MIIPVVVLVLGGSPMRRSAGLKVALESIGRTGPRLYNEIKRFPELPSIPTRSDSSTWAYENFGQVYMDDAKCTFSLKGGKVVSSRIELRNHWAPLDWVADELGIDHEGFKSSIAPKMRVYGSRQKIRSVLENFMSKGSRQASSKAFVMVSMPFKGGTTILLRCSPYSGDIEGTQEFDPATGSQRVSIAYNGLSIASDVVEVIATSSPTSFLAGLQDLGMKVRS